MHDGSSLVEWNFGKINNIVKCDILILFCHNQIEKGIGSKFMGAKGGKRRVEFLFCKESK